MKVLKLSFVLALLFLTSCQEEQFEPSCITGPTWCMKITYTLRSCPDSANPELKIYQIIPDSTYTQWNICDTAWWKIQAQLGWSAMIANGIRDGVPETVTELHTQNYPYTVCSGIEF